MHMKKCITIHVLLGNIRPRFRCRKMQLPEGELTGPPPGLYYATAGEGGGRGLVYCAMTDGYCMLCLWHASQTKRHKSITEGGAINRAASPAASLSPRHCLEVIYTVILNPSADSFPISLLSCIMTSGIVASFEINISNFISFSPFLQFVSTKQFLRSCQLLL